MLKSTARHRVALKIAALSALGVGFIAAGGLIVPAQADQRVVRYNCTPIVGGVPQTPQQHDLTVNLAAAPATVSVGTGFTATFQVVSAGQAPLQAPGEIPITSTIVIEPLLEVEGNPSPSSLVTVTPSAVHSVTTPIASGAALPPPPAATATITPSTGATSIVITGGSFTIKVITAGAQPLSQDLFRCVPPVDATLPVATVAVGTGTAPSTPGTPPVTTTPTVPTAPITSTMPTTRVTTTFTKTVTAPPVEVDDGQVSRTPEGGAATGGGGEMGPDGRVFVLVGSLLVLGAAAAGLFLRRRTATPKS